MQRCRIVLQLVLNENKRMEEQKKKGKIRGIVDYIVSLTLLISNYNFETKKNTSTKRGLLSCDKFNRLAMVDLQLTICRDFSSLLWGYPLANRRD